MLIALHRSSGKLVAKQHWSPILEYHPMLYHMQERAACLKHSVFKSKRSVSHARSFKSSRGLREEGRAKQCIPIGRPLGPTRNPTTSGLTATRHALFSRGPCRRRVSCHVCASNYIRSFVRSSHRGRGGWQPITCRRRRGRSARCSWPRRAPTYGFRIH